MPSRLIKITSEQPNFIVLKKMAPKVAIIIYTLYGHISILAETEKKVLKLLVELHISIKF